MFKNKCTYLPILKQKYLCFARMGWEPFGIIFYF